jgi:hypothetical protein
MEFFAQEVSEKLAILTDIARAKRLLGEAKIPGPCRDSGRLIFGWLPGRATESFSM